MPRDHLHERAQVDTECWRLRPESECEGHHFAIHALLHPNGSSPVTEFLSELDEKTRKGIDALFDLLCTTGRIRNKEMFKKIEGTNLFEFKRFQIRLLCFYTDDKKVVLCHAVVKKKDRHKASDLKLAEQRRQAYLNAKRERT